MPFNIYTALSNIVTVDRNLYLTFLGPCIVRIF